jgi:hypothetical protein
MRLVWAGNEVARYVLGYCIGLNLGARGLKPGISLDLAYVWKAMPCIWFVCNGTALHRIYNMGADGST